MVFESAQSRDLVEVLPFAMVAQQLNPNPRRFGVWLAEGLRSTKDQSVQANIVTTVSLNCPDLMMAALNTQISKRARWKRFVPRSLIEVNRSPSNRSIASAGRSVLSLSTVMRNTSNPFSQENGVLMLARTLLMDQEVCEGLGRGLTGEGIVLECEDWSCIQSLPSEEGFLSIQPTGHVEVSNPLYETPPWVDDTKAWLYGLGRILRSALTGEFDFTSRRYVVTEDIGRYSGLRSTWFKRRFGLLNSGRGLLEEPGPVSPWLSGLLSTLLQWPGVDFRANEVVKAGFVGTPEELLIIIEARIAEQKKLFGARSNTPMYVVPTDDHAPLEDRPIRIAIIQTLRPRRDEFNVKDPAHWPVGDIAQHRRHLAEVCRLAHQKLRTWDSAQALTSTEDEGARRVVDVVLFPELAVHPEHVFLLRRLSDLLRANIFAGLTFLKSPLLGTLVNQGIWLIRTESPRHGRSIQYVWQGKLHPTRLETSMGIKGHRPHLTLVELPVGIGSRTRIAAAICYDATDLDLVADLRDRSDIFLVAALNQDVQTFDNMVAALHFHMYQPIVLANTGEFGGSTAQAPLPKHERLISHVHGNNQVAVNVFEIDPEPFKSIRRKRAPRGLKNPPAGYRGRPV